jgi:O-antigen/teichoic acid export membrane protein
MSLEAGCDIVIGQRSYLVVLTQVGSPFLSYIGLIFIIHYLGSDTFGAIAGTLALVGVFKSFSDLGSCAAHVKRVSEGKDIHDCVSTYAAVRLLLTVVVVAIALA